MAIELVRIRTAQQYPMLMPTLFPGDLATRKKPYDSLASMWTEFANLKHNTSPAIDGGAFASASQASSLHAPPTIATPVTSVAAPQRHNSRAARPPHDISRISHAHSRRDPFSVDYGLWPFDDRDYAIVCTVTNHIVNTNLSLWTPSLLKTPAVRRVYNIAAAVVTAGRRTTASDGALPPSRMYFPFSTPSLPRRTLTALYSRRGKKECAVGAAAALTADIKVMADEMRLGLVTPAPITEDLPRRLKVTVVG